MNDRRRLKLVNTSIRLDSLKNHLNEIRDDVEDVLSEEEEILGGLSENQEDKAMEMEIAVDALTETLEIFDLIEEKIDDIDEKLEEAREC